MTDQADINQEFSTVHKYDADVFSLLSRNNGKTAWRQAKPPDLKAPDCYVGRLRSCDYCGSMHPADLANALRNGATASWSDFKYGWPHKAYIDGVPNPHAGLLESRGGRSHAVPICPKTGALCEQGEQSFRHPKCACMKDEPELVTSGCVGTEKSVSLTSVPDGFDPDTGRILHTWRELGEPAPQLTYGKFYSVHLIDATAEDRALIERHLGTSFVFEDNPPAGLAVSWSPIPRSA